MLVIDWDLEAPRLHRYFHPFLEDPELEHSPGLIDYAVEFAEAARHVKRDNPLEQTSSSGESWYARHTSLLRYTYSLDWDFGEGTLDFVPAGRQGPGYSLRVNGFDWQQFYERLGGGVLLEAVKNRLSEDYDYVLIDSRTGISDTSGICTVQMPDDLVVCFTLNLQSINGAAAVAASADQQRRRATGEASLRIWPIPTRVELAEKERLGAARDVARATFHRYLREVERVDRATYWRDIEVLYQPYFAYEEVLAVFAEKRGQKASMLSSMEFLTGQLTTQAISELTDLPESARVAGFKRFQRAAAPAGIGPRRGEIFISYPSNDAERVERIARELRERFGEAVWLEHWDLRGDEPWMERLVRALDRARVVVAFFGRAWASGSHSNLFNDEIRYTLERGTPLFPVLMDDQRVSEWAAAAEKLGLEELTSRRAWRLPPGLSADAAALAGATDRFWIDETARPTNTPEVDPEDPQKGQWGGRSTVEDRPLSAEVREIGPTWFDITLSVAATGEHPLASRVEFHLHPTFSPSARAVDVTNGRATLRVSAYGAFTVGAVADKGSTKLELDLSEDPSFPERFRTH